MDEEMEERGESGVLARTEKTLVEDGHFNLGADASPFSRINPLDAKLRFAGIPLPRLLKKIALKEWQHFALSSPRFFVSVAIFDSKRLVLLQVIVYDRREGKKFESERLVAPWSVQLPNELWNAKVAGEKRGLSLSFHNHLEAGKHHIEFELAAGKKGEPSVRGAFAVQAAMESHAPLVVCLPLSRRRALYSHKGVFPVSGRLSIGQDTHEFLAEDSFAIADIHKGYYPYRMAWDWATGALRDGDGQLWGFNLTDNQVEEQHRYNENVIWRGSELHRLPPVRFHFASGEGAWRIEDERGRVRLRFEPEVERNFNFDLWLLKSRYRSAYGRFYGVLEDYEGKELRVDGAYGMGEDFFLRC